MREVIRDFAFDHLTPEEAEVVQRRHAGWCVIAAAEFLDEAIALFVVAADRNFTARSTAYRGYAALLRGDLPGAESLMATSLVTFRDLDEDWGVAEGLEGMSAVCAVAGQGDRAARLAGAAEQLRSKLATRGLPSDRAMVARCLGGPREQIGEPIWAAAQEAGRAMSLAAAIDEALGQRLSTLVDAG